MAAPRSVGPAVYSGLPPTLTPLWPLLQCAAPGRSSQCGTRGFLGLTANPHHSLVPPGVLRHLAAPRSVGPAVYSGLPPTHHSFGPSWSVRLLAAPRSVGPAVYSGLPPTHHSFGPSWSVRLLAAPRSVGPAVYSGLPPTHHSFGPSWSVRLLAAPRSVGPAVFLGSPPNPLAQNSPKTQKLENSTLQQERAHTRFNEYTLTRPQCIVHT